MRKRRAFTLMEMMIVVAILGVIAAGATVSMRTMVTRGKNMEAENILYSLFMAQKDYFRENNGVYTNTLTDLDIDIPTMKHFTINAISTGSTAGCVTNGLVELRSLATPVYDLWIDDQGLISCEVGNNCSDLICTKLGY